MADGVVARVVHDESRERGVPVEITDDYYAQDAKGNVWYMGEATTAYEKGKPASTEGSFEAGVDGARPGVDHARAPQGRHGLPAGVPQRATPRTARRSSRSTSA